MVSKKKIKTTSSDPTLPCQYCKKSVTFSSIEEYRKARNNKYYVLCKGCNDRAISTDSDPLTDLVKFNRYALEMLFNPPKRWYAADMMTISKTYLEHTTAKARKNKDEK